MTTIELATQRLLDSVWSLVYEQLNEKQIRIISYSRNNREGYHREKYVQKCRLVEDEKRIVTSVKFAPYDPFNFTEERECEVVNPQHIFSY